MRIDLNKWVERKGFRSRWKYAKWLEIRNMLDGIDEDIIQKILEEYKELSEVISPKKRSCSCYAV